MDLESLVTKQLQEDEQLDEHMRCVCSQLT